MAMNHGMAGAFTLQPLSESLNLQTPLPLSPQSDLYAKQHLGCGDTAMPVRIGTFWGAQAPS